MKEYQKKQSKQQIQSLAELCINKIYENKFLNNQKERYTYQINFIKTILMNNSKTESNKNNNISQNKNIILIDQIKSFYNSLIASNFQLKKEENKILSKLNTYKDELLKEDSMNKQLLSNIKYDNLILIYQLKERDDIIKGLDKAFESLKHSPYFKENKKEIQVNNKWGQYYLQVNSNKLAEKMMAECQHFIQFRNKCEKKEKEKIKINKKIEMYKELIKYYKNYANLNTKNNSIKKENKKTNDNNKISKDKKSLHKTAFIPNKNILSLYENDDNTLFDDILLVDEEKMKKDEININKSINEKEQLCSSVLFNPKNVEKILKYQTQKINYKKGKNVNKSSKSIKNFLTVEELFDINNHEGKEEAIIDDELHSDDETVFEIKVKPLKKITIHYIPKIKRQVPKINLAQIEFNKQKVMNEADLYSLQRRNYKMQNLEENIKTMKKKIKKLRHICKINKKKLEVFEKYAKNIEENYKALKPLKVQSSLAGVKIPKIQKFFEEGDKNGNINDLEGIDFEDEDSDILENEEFHDVNNTEANTRKGFYFNDKNNLFIKSNYFDKINNNDIHLEHKGTLKKRNHYNNNSIRANSK